MKNLLIFARIISRITMKNIFFPIFAAVALICSCQQIEPETSLGTVECCVENVDYTSVQIRYVTDIPQGVSGCMVGVVVASEGDPMTEQKTCKFSGGMYETQSGVVEGRFNVDGLKPGTSYNVRACIVSSADGRMVWSEMDSFSTPHSSDPLCTSIEEIKVGTTTAILKVNWEGKGNNVKRVGLLYSKDQRKLNFYESQSVESDGIFELSGLEMSTRYYIMPYFVVDEAMFLAETTFFDTKAPVAGNAVDLGLSVKWADMNIGAFEPKEYGAYFAWGEIASKTDYNLSTYKYFDSFHPGYTKYVTRDSFGTVDNKSVLEKSDDAASVCWGGNWRMPTRDECKELINDCSWTFVSDESIGKGYLVQSKKPGYTDKSIFLPVAGIRGVNGNMYVGSYVTCWSSTLETVNNTGAYALDVESESFKSTTSYYRLNGCPIRPVTK